MIGNEPAIPPERFAAVVRHHLKPLFNFVRREIAYREAIGDLAYGEVAAGDVVDEVLPTTIRPPCLPRGSTPRSQRRTTALSYDEPLTVTPPNGPDACDCLA
jgi:hypothetical protein